MHNSQWQDAPKGEVNQVVLERVSQIEATQQSIFDRFVKLSFLYDPNSIADAEAYGVDARAMHGRDANVQENLIAANVDTVHSIIAATEIRPRFLTDDADWSTQRLLSRLGRYSEGLGKKLDIQPTSQRGFKDGAIKGTGLVKVYADKQQKRIRVERTLVDDIVVDESETRHGPPKQMHERKFVRKDELKERFPKHAAAIDQAHGSQTSGTYRWASYRPFSDEECVVIESWYLPCGKKPGRHTITIDGADLLDEKWEHDWFPFAVFRWYERDKGWYGIGLAERLAGHQRATNKLNWQIDRQLDQHAVPTTYVRMADANAAVRTANRAGAIVPIKGDMPQTVIPQAVSNETYQRHAQLRESAFEESGVSRMAATAKKPGGLDSGVALREYKDQTTQRFAQQEKRYERFVLDAYWLAIHAAKELGADAPKIAHKTRWGKQWIQWSEVDMGDLRIQIAAASNISRTPAGRMQQVVEWAQAGLISQDEARRLMSESTLDLEREVSLYTAAIEDIERSIEEILDGGVVVPEPFQSLEIGLRRFQGAYLRAREEGAPEEILENLRQWMTLAGWILNPPEQPGMEPGAEPAPAGDAPVPDAGGAPSPAAPGGPAGPAPVGMGQPGGPPAAGGQPDPALAAQLAPQAGAI